MNNITILILMQLFGLTQLAFSQGQMQWMTMSEAQERSKVEKRKIFVDVHTDWCGWCKKMDKTTFSDPRITHYMNKNYYAVKLDAEEKNDIILKEKIYKFNKHGARGYHDLAKVLLNGQMSYPSIVFLDEDFNPIQAIPGYQDGKNFLMIASYFAGNMHKSTPWNKYVEEFTAKEKAWKPYGN
ncbi:MAG: DUF255 domain-containing protein [Saprospiraceae bacterium]